MYKVSQGQKKRLCKDGRCQYIDSLIIGAKARGDKDCVQWYI